MTRLGFLRIAVLGLALVVRVSGAESGSRTEMRFEIAAGTEYATEAFVIDSGGAGPTVLIIGGMHGNEPAGAAAAAQIRHWPIVAGRLVVIPRANVLALDSATRRTPGRPSQESDLNRNFPQVETDEGYEARPIGFLAGEVWTFVREIEPDWVFDLHEGFEFHRSHQPPEGKKRSVGSSVIYVGGDALDPLVDRMITAVDATIPDPERRFSRLRSGPVSTGITRACINVLGAQAMILETTYQYQPLSLRTRQHRTMVSQTLLALGVVEQDCRDLLTVSGGSDRLAVGVFDGEGTGPSREALVAVLGRDDAVDVFSIGSLEMTPDCLSQFDVLVFPGGGGSKQARALGVSGREAVRAYVRRGGGVVGVCAGAYLCSAHYGWSLNLVDASVLTGAVEIPGVGTKQIWYRGKGAMVECELTDRGRELFPGVTPEFVVRYANGPILSPKGDEALEDYEVWAWYRSETGLWEPQKGTMIHTPAIVANGFGSGRVVSIGPHPESSRELDSLISRSVRWAAGALD